MVRRNAPLPGQKSDAQTRQCSSTAGRTGALFDKSPMLPLPTWTQAERVTHSGDRQGADRQADDGFTCRPGGTGKTFNSLCTTMLSATATVRASSQPPWHKRSTLQYLPGGVLGVHFLDNALKNAVLVEDECSPERPQRGLPVHFLLTPRAEGLEHLRGGVRK